MPAFSLSAGNDINQIKECQLDRHLCQSLVCPSLYENDTGHMGRGTKKNNNNCMSADPLKAKRY